MSKGENFEVIERHCSKNEWNKVKRISIYYEETKLLKWISFIDSGFSFHRTYFLKITYKNEEFKTIRILPKEKDVIKPYITPFNFMLNGLVVSQGIKI
jgi:hypothetical protein